MRKFIFGISLLIIVLILGLTSSQMAPENKASAAGALDHFVFSRISTQRAGTAFQITIAAVDAHGFIVTSYVGTNTLGVSSGTISPTSTSSFRKGYWTGQVTLTRAATGIIISTTGSSKFGTSNTFNVNAGGLALFAFSNISVQTAGTSFSITITAQDAYGNTIIGYKGPNTLSDLTGTVNPMRTGSFSAGSWTGQVTITKAATNVTISTSGYSKVGQSNSITVSPGDLARFTITGYPTSVTSGQNFGSNNVVVTAYDGYGNIKTDYVGSVYFNSTDAHPILPFTLGSRYTFTSGASQDNGVHTFAGTGFTLKTTPSQTITVTDGSMYATSNPITVTPRSITVTSNPTGSGYIRVDGQTYVTPATFNWTVGDSHNISANSPVIITSNQSRYTYSSWSDSGSQSHTITVSLTSISTFTANFRLQYYHSVSGSALIVDSNSTVTGLAFNSTSRKLSFTVSGASETTGYANITIAKSLIGDINGIMVYLDGNLINFNSVSIGDSWLLQFTYQHSDHRVDVSLGSAPATTGSPGLGPLTPSMISMIGVISGVVLLVTLAWPLLGEAKRRFPKSAPGILRAPFLGLKLLFGETYRRSHAIFP